MTDKRKGHETQSREEKREQAPRTPNAGARFGYVLSAALLLNCAFWLALSIGGCASAPTRTERALYDVTTNYVPHVIVQQMTNYVPVFVERTNTVIVTNAATGLAESVVTRVTLTNLVTLVSLQTNTVTATNYVLAPNAGTEAAIRATASTVGGLAGPFGGLAGALAVGAYHMWASIRNRKVNAALVQGIQTGREILLTTPQGDVAEAKYRTWLMDHQSAAGVIDVVSGLVDKYVDNEAARGAASLIKEASQPAAPTPAPAAA